MSRKKKSILTKTAIVRAHLEETGGDANKLLAILQKSGYPDAKKHDVYNTVHIARKAKKAKRGRKPLNANAEVKTSAPKTNGVDKTSALASALPTFAVRFAVALAKIAEGEAELKALQTEVAGMEKLADGYRAAEKLFNGGKTDDVARVM